MKVQDIKGNMSNVEIMVRIIKILPQRTIKTKKGEDKLIQEIIAGDETGRINITLWENIENLKEGDIIKIVDGWTTVFNNKIELNIGRKSKIMIVNDNSLPSVEQIPDTIQNIGEYRIPLKGR